MSRSVLALLAMLALGCLALPARAYKAPLRPPRLAAASKARQALEHVRSPIDDCEERWRTATLDHFSWVRSTRC